MVNNNNNSIVAALFGRAMSLRVRSRALALSAIETGREFTRLRAEVVGRQELDAWASYEEAKQVVSPVVRRDRFVQEDAHVLDYVNTRLEVSLRNLALQREYEEARMW